MLSHANLAVSGLLPGLLTTMSVANLGYYDTTVIIEPVVPFTGGGYIPATRQQKPDRYRVTVQIRCDGKLYEDTVIVDDTEARIYAKLNGIDVFTPNDVMISINKVQQITEPVVVLATLNSTKQDNHT